MINFIKYKITDLETKENNVYAINIKPTNDEGKAFDEFLYRTIGDFDDEKTKNVESWIIGVDEKTESLILGTREKNFYEISNIEFKENF